MINYTVKQATPQQIEDILSEPQIASKTVLPVSTILERKLPYFILEYSGYRLLASLFTLDKGVLEAHIACPKDSIVASRVLVLLGFKWVFKEANKANIHTIITTAPRGKIANFATKLGFIEYKTEASLAGVELVYFKYTKGLQS